MCRCAFALRSLRSRRRGTGRGESEIAAAQRRAYVLGELPRVNEQRLVHTLDRLAAGHQVGSRRGEHGIGFVQRGHAVDVADIRPFQEEPAEVFGLGHTLAFIEVAHFATGSIYARPLTFGVIGDKELELWFR